MYNINTRKEQNMFERVTYACGHSRLNTSHAPTYDKTGVCPVCQHKNKTNRSEVLATQRHMTNGGAYS